MLSNALWNSVLLPGPFTKQALSQKTVLTKRTSSCSLEAARRRSHPGNADKGWTHVTNVLRALVSHSSDHHQKHIGIDTISDWQPMELLHLFRRIVPRTKTSYDTDCDIENSPQVCNGSCIVDGSSVSTALQ